MSKPIIVLKVGRTAGAARAVVSHIGALAGSDDALEAAFRRAGVLRVDTIEELFGLAEILAKQPRPPGPRLAIVTNGGGPGALATDALLDAGGELAPLSETTLTALNACLPPFWSKNNPVDLLGDADPERFAQAVQAVGKQHGAGAFLGVTVQPMVPANGYEVLLGSTTDPQLGPVVVFGTGGQLVEVIKDRALGLPPLNATLARRLMESCRIYRAFKGVRGRESIDFAALETLLIRFSRLVAEQRRIKEIDVDPLLASPARIVALDARVVLHDPNVIDDELPKLAIRPYPTEYIFHKTLKDGTPVTLRPICPEDEPLVAEFHKTLSEQTVHYRYFAYLKLEYRIAHKRLRQICFNDYDCEIALVIERKTPKTGQREILGIGRLIKGHDVDEAEFAIVVSDGWQDQGLGTELLSRLLHIGRQERVGRIVGYILPDNLPMRRVCEKLAFNLSYNAGAEAYKAVVAL